jgi:hypothetical protein
MRKTDSTGYMAKDMRRINSDDAESVVDGKTNLTMITG